jgi:hypothetical protein
MSIPLNETGHFANFIEYNSYRFGPRTKLIFSIRPHLHPSQRVVVSKTYNVKIVSYITPRRPIPGDTTFSGIQLKAPFQKQKAPGIYPYSMLATTDTEMEKIFCKLEEPGKTLRIVGYGMGDLYVNTIDPNFKQYIQDLEYGPHTTDLKCRPVGWNKAWFIEWDFTTTINNCCSQGVDLNDPTHRIQEYTFSVNYSVNELGRETRTTAGRLIIVPPVNRFPTKRNNTNILPGDPNFDTPVPAANNPFPTQGIDGNDATKTPFGVFAGDNQSNNFLFETVDQYTSIVENAIPLPFRFRRIGRNFNIGPDQRTLQFTIVDQEQAPYSMVPGYVKVTGTHNTTYAKTFSDRQFISTISCNFTLPTYENVNANQKPKQPYSEINVNDANLTKKISNKLVAQYDFYKLCTQRFCHLIFAARNPINTLPWGFAGEGRTHFLIKSFDVNENIFDTSIGFSLSFFIVCPLEALWINIGTGRPAILATDLIDDKSNKIVVKGFGDITDTKTPELEDFVNKIVGSKYTDSYKHADWIVSQRYSAMNHRGSGGLILGLSSGETFDICDGVPRTATTVTTLPTFKIPTFRLPNFNDPNAPTPNPHRNKTPDVKIDNPPEDAFNKPGKNISPDPGTPNPNKLPEKPDPDPNENLKPKNPEQLLPLTGQTIGMTYMGQSGVNSTFQGTISPKAEEDIDLYFDDNIIEKTQVDFGSVTVLPYDTNTDNISDPVEGFMINTVLSMIGVPTPEGSWLEYVSSIEEVTENHVLRHKKLPTQDLAPQSPGDSSIDTLMETNFDTVANIGPDYLYGESINSRKYFEKPLDDDIIQIASSPSIKLILRGFGVRVNYPVNAPTLLKYGGAKVVQKSRKVNRALLGHMRWPIFGATWEIEYLVENAPVGVLGVPENAVISDYDDTNASKLSEATELLNTFYFSLDPANINNPNIDPEQPFYD